MTISQNYEQQLTAILSLLNPPQQDYATLADDAWHFLNTLPSEPSEERVLTTYFELFATGYTQWQQSYNYPRIHEYFYGAYLRAKKEAGNLFTKAVEMLEMMTKAMIAYTNCENALINNDPQQLLQSARQAVKHGKNALDRLSQIILENNITSEIDSYLHKIDSYLKTNCHLWQGLAICAQGYLDAQQSEELSDSVQREMEQLLRDLEPESQELFSELNAHYSFVQRQSQFRKKMTSSLRIKKGTLFLRAIGYISEKEVKALFKKFAAKNEQLSDFIQKTKLPIENVRASVLMDIFETVLGKQYLDQIIFDFSPNEPVLTFKLNMGSKEIVYQPDVFHISIARFGTISVEFGIPLENVSVPHVRALESLISPHAGRLNIGWKGVSEEPGEDSDAANPIDYVEYFLYCQEMLCSLQKILPAAEATKLATIRSILDDWESILRKLTKNLQRQAANAGDEDQKVIKERNKNYKSLQGDFNRVYPILQSYLNNSTTVQDPDLKRLYDLGRDLFAEGRHFGRLIDIVELIMSRFLEHGFILEANELSQKQHQMTIQLQDVRFHSKFDCNMGWQSILYCNQLVIVEANGEELKPGVDVEYQSALTHPEFKGFAIQSREARAAIDDWIFVVPPKVKNLATIRSHENDVLYVGVNKAFLWFPDDPQFLTDQYTETTRLIADIRTLVLTFNNYAKEQITQLEEFLEKFEEAKDVRNIGLTKILEKVKNIRNIGLTKTLEEEQHVRNVTLKQTQDELLERRKGIEIFYIHAERVLDLLRACTISKYQDHSELLKRMLRESEADDSKISLERNIKNLGRFHEYLSGLIQQKIEERNKSNQILLNRAVFVLTLFSALSAITALFSFVDPRISGTIGHSVLFWLTVALLVLIVVSCVSIGLFVWRRIRNT